MDSSKTLWKLLKEKRILVVDDEETLCEALRFNFEAEGYEVDTAGSAEDALGMELSRYDLFLLDIMMGDISGVQLARILKKNPATSGIPVIFCSARDSEDDVVSGLDLGADDYITKPYSLRTVSARVRSVLRRSAALHNPDSGAGELRYKGLVVDPHANCVLSMALRCVCLVRSSRYLSCCSHGRVMCSRVRRFFRVCGLMRLLCSTGWWMST